MMRSLMGCGGFGMNLFRVFEGKASGFSRALVSAIFRFLLIILLGCPKIRGGFS